MKTAQKPRMQRRNQQYSQEPSYITPKRKFSQSSQQQQIIIKNLDSGTREVLNIQQVDQVQQICKQVSMQTKVSLWNSYFQQQTKIDQKLLKFVLQKKFQDLNRILNEQPIQLNKFKFTNGWTLLHHAVVSSNIKVVQLLLDNKIDINATSNQMKRTALHQAVLQYKFQTVQLLIQNMADPNIQDIDGYTSVHYAAELSYEQIFSVLLASDIHIDFRLKNYQQMTILDCIRDQKLYKQVQVIYPQQIDQNQNQAKSHNENRRIIKINNEVIKKLSKNDLIQKFLSIKQVPRVSSYQHVHTKKIKAQFSDSIKSQSSIEGAKKIRTLGKKPSQWIKKKGQLIAMQSIYLMKQSIVQQINEDIESLENYQILRFIGKGGFAQVFLARKKKSTSRFAIKRISKQQILKNNLKRYVYAQRNLMIKCQHPFIIQAYSMFQDSTYLYIVMQYCECGDLQRLIKDKGKLPEEQVKVYAAQIGLALQAMHRQNILFRDLKSANVLIAKDGYLKISDFGLAKQSLVSFSFLGSYHYLAPEMLVQTQMKEHTKSIDWYLFGVLLYELLTGNPPFYGQKQHVLFKKIKQVRPSLPGFLSQECRTLLLSLLQKNPLKRIGSSKDFQQIKQSSWLQKIDYEKLLDKKLQMTTIEQTIKQDVINKKVPFDDFSTNQTFQYFKQWNYIRPNLKP